MLHRNVPICDQLFKVIVTAQTLLYIVVPFWGKTLAESLLMYAILFSQLGIVVFGILLNRKKVDKVGFLLFALLIVVSLTSAMWNGQIFTYSVLIAIMNFFVTFAPFFVVGFLTQSSRNYQFIRRMGIVQAFALVLVACSSRGYAPYYASGYLIDDGALTLGFVNPNVTAAYLFYVFSLNLRSVLNEKNTVTRCALLALVCVLEYLIFETECRALIVLSVLMAIVALCGKRIGTLKVCLDRRVLVCCVLMPMIFLFVYSYAYANHSSLKIMGEDIFARIEIFQEAYESIKLQPILGNVVKHQFSNTHNGYLAILLNIGLVGLISYTIYIYYHLNQFRKQIDLNNDKMIVPYVYMLTILIHACVEAGGLIGGAMFGANMLMSCYLCKDNSMA